ncbi:hypothetical protein SUGI_0550830 [Cryptomeria japonica]|nr:hypothetical protein SUGI_0550830 [Cryptomeria japonica]
MVVDVNKVTVRMEERNDVPSPSIKNLRALPTFLGHALKLQVLLQIHNCTVRASFKSSFVSLQVKTASLLSRLDV